MAVVPKNLYSGSPATSNVNVGTPAVGKKWIIKNIIIANVTENDAVGKIMIGGTGASNEVLGRAPVVANDTIVIDTSLVVEAGTILYVSQTTASALNFNISAVEVDV